MNSYPTGIIYLYVEASKRLGYAVLFYLTIVIAKFHKQKKRERERETFKNIFSPLTKRRNFFSQLPILTFILYA